MLAAAGPMTPDAQRPLSQLRHHDGAADSNTMSSGASSGDTPVRQLLSMPSYLPQDQPDEEPLQQPPLQDDQLLLDDVPSPSPNSGEDAAAVLAALFKQQHHNQLHQATTSAAAIRVSSSPSTAPGSDSAAAGGAAAAPRHPVLMQKFPSIGRASHPASNGHGSTATAGGAEDGDGSTHHSSTTAATASSNGSSSGTGDPVTPAPHPPTVESAAAPSPASPLDAAAGAGGVGSGVMSAANGIAHLQDPTAAAVAGAGTAVTHHTQRAPRESSSSSVSGASLKVSLLSQQLADVQRRTAAIEAAGGASGRGQSLFWQHIHSTAPAARSNSHTAVAAAAAAAAAADASRSSEAARSAARHQRQLEEEYQQQYRHQHYHQQQRQQQEGQQQQQQQGRPWPGASAATGSPSGRIHQQEEPTPQQQQQGTASGQQSPSQQQQRQQQQQQPAGDDDEPADARGATATTAGSSFRSGGGRLLQPPPAQAPQQQQQQQQQGIGSPERPSRAFSRVSSGTGSLLGQVLSLDPHSWGDQEAPLSREAAAAAAAAAGGPSGGAAPHQLQQQGLNGHYTAAGGVPMALGGMGGYPPSSTSPGGLVPHSLHMLPERFGLLNSPSVKSFLLKHRSADFQAVAAAAAAGGPAHSSNQLQPQGSGGVSDPQRLTLYMPEPQQQPPPQQQQQQQGSAAGDAPLHPQLYWVGSPELMEPLLGPAHGSRLSVTPLPLGPQLGVGWEPGLGLTLSSPGGHGGLPRSGSRRGLLAAAAAAGGGVPGVVLAPAAGGVAAPAGLGDFQELMEQLLEELSCCGQVTSEEAGADLAAACSIHHVCFGGPPVVAGRGWWEAHSEQVRDAWEAWQGRAVRRCAQLWRLLQQLWQRCAEAVGHSLQQAGRASSRTLVSHLSSSGGHMDRGPGAGGLGVGVSPLGRHQAPGYRPWR